MAGRHLWRNEGSTVGAAMQFRKPAEPLSALLDQSDTILNLIKNGYLLCTDGAEPGCHGL
jgi:ribose transport system substrate-binding protein